MLITTTALIVGLCTDKMGPSIREPQNRQHLTASVGEIRVEVFQRQEKYSERLVKCWGGPEIREAGTYLVVSMIKIHERGRPIRVPLSAYSDLSAVSSVTASAKRGRTLVSLTGGDAASSYDAELWIRGEYVVRRRVWSREFPKYHREETTYTNIAPPEG
jgi:hypothetical protein